MSKQLNTWLCENNRVKGRYTEVTEFIPQVKSLFP